MSPAGTPLKAGASRNRGSSEGLWESFPKKNQIKTNPDLLISFSPRRWSTAQISRQTIDSETLIDAVRLEFLEA